MKRIKLFFTVLSALVGSALALAQDLTVTGVVTDSDTGEPVPFTTIQIKGTLTGGSSDAEGNYSILVPANGVLIFSSVGYESQEVEVAGVAVHDISLSPDAEALEGTVVIGYGSGQKVGNIVGSVKTVSSDDIASRPSGNIGDALQGKVSGLQVFNTSGEPQSSVSIRLRGVSSLNLSTEPLYILDGVPVSSSVFTSLNPQDIENISILKDASSTAIYGSRAANGVIYVSTKKGMKGEKPTISLRAQYGISMLTNYNMDMMNSEQLLRFEEMCQPQLANDPTFLAKKAFILGNGIDFDWTDYLYDDAAPIVQADASIRGGSEKTSYYVSLGYYSEQGTSKANSGTNRATIRSNIDTQVTDWLKFGVNLALTYTKYQTIVTGWYTQSPILQAVTGIPYYTPYDLIYNEDGTISYGDVMTVYPFQNQMIDLNEYYENCTNNRNTANIMGQTYFQITPMKGLTIRAAQAIDAFDYTNESVNNPSYYPIGDSAGRNAQAFQRYYQLSSTNTIEYKTDFGGSKHYLAALVGHESILRHEKIFNATGVGLTDDRLTAFGSTTDVTSWNGYDEEATSNSFFANFNYNFDNRYFVDASVRTDGSSLFGENHRYATFFSVGAMWKIRNEKFMSDVNWINDLDLSVSYGTTGNSGLSSWYTSQGLVGTGPRYNGNAGWALSQVPNADLTWETVANLNVGLSGRLWDRLSFDIEFYNRETKNMLMEMPFSATTGHTSGWGNIAGMYNRGVDVELSVDLIHTRNVYWGITANFNYNKNAITKLFQGLDELVIANTGLKYEVGKSSSLVYTPIRAGVDPADGSPVWYDLNGNLTKSFSDELSQFWEGHDSVSPWSGGFSTNFSWKGFGLNADFSWIGNRWIWLNEFYYTRNPQNLLFNTNFETKMLDMWTTPGQVTDVPKYGTPFQFDSAAYSNASFLRLKNISLSYSFPEKLIKKSGVLSGVKIYVTGRNLWTVTGFEGYDPEVGYSNATQGMYPNSRQIVFGAELVF